MFDSIPSLVLRVELHMNGVHITVQVVYAAKHLLRRTNVKQNTNIS